MKQNIANYTVVIDKEKRTGTNKDCYTALVPALGIATEAHTLKQVKKDIKELVQFHVECLSEEGSEVPVESEESFVTKVAAFLPSKTRLAA